MNPSGLSRGQDDAVQSARPMGNKHIIFSQPQGFTARSGAPDVFEHHHDQTHPLQDIEDVSFLSLSLFLVFNLRSSAGALSHSDWE